MNYNKYLDLSRFDHWVLLGLIAHTQPIIAGLLRPKSVYFGGRFSCTLGPPINLHPWKYLVPALKYVKFQYILVIVAVWSVELGRNWR